MKHLLILEGSSVIIGTVVGAGVLGLPFAFVKAGFLTGLTLLIIISFCLTLLSLFLGEVALRTKGNHQLTGYTELYLGATFKHIQAILMLFGMYGALLAYTIGFGQILSSLFGASPIVWSIGVYALLSYLVVRGLGIIKKAEFIIAILIIGLIFTLAIITTPHLSYTHLTGFDWFSFLIPYGAILFACSGLAAIPEAKEILETKKGTKFLRSVIILGHLVPTVIYIIFTLVVVGVTGPETTEIATIGLSSKIGLIALAIGSLFSIIAMSSSFMTLGTAIKGIFQYDYRLKPTNALVATLSIPLILFLIGFREFFGVVSVVGALGVGLSGLITLLVFWRSRQQGLRKPEYSISNWLAVPATALIGLIFVLGLIYTL